MHCLTCESYITKNLERLVLNLLLFFSKQDNASALKTQLDQQKGVVDNLVSNTRVSFRHFYLYILYFDLL